MNLKEEIKKHELSEDATAFIQKHLSFTNEDYSETKMEEYSSFIKAIKVADYAHKIQVRKLDKEKYINHPLRVALSLKNVESIDDTYAPIHYQIVGVLHDVIEDSFDNLGYTIDGIDLNHFGISTELTEAIYLLTKKEGENYFDFIMRVLNSRNELAIRVKLADIEDNLRGNNKGSLFDKYRLSKYILTEELKKMTLIKKYVG